MPALPSHARKRLGLRLKTLRTEAGLTVDNVVETLGWGRTKLIRIESAKVNLNRHDLHRLGNMYDASPEELQILEELVEETRATHWWQAEPYRGVLTEALADFIALESTASRIAVAETGVVPGLLQSPEYAAAVFASQPHVPDPDLAAVRVELRMRRQRILVEENVVVSAAIGEGLLYAATGGKDVLRGQIRRLIDLCELPNVDLRIIPFDAERAILSGGITLFDFPDEHSTSVVYSEYEGSMLARDSDLDIRRFRRLLDHLTSQSLSSEDTRKMLQTRLESV
ncbi:helix-turn-helix domain-containing protein [Yinghuangia sp. ASG 101]|uniref:helix-turn-helix domain-containing protein n=1 Tax=Yinghuangia sp. ASG 101 TaxID=2896848 RepID=UPI001E5E87A3|nr:helix-turn-helix transcriptional regulator [Yinghuangia sp. ASG 101]UGQ15220.1 helix-turn-helix domain-containing protein [Yinghuangia sp. ASG 101]